MLRKTDIKDDSKEFDFKIIGRSDISKNGGIRNSKLCNSIKTTKIWVRTVRINFMKSN